MYFIALQSVLIKGLRFVVRPYFFYNTKTLSKTDILHRVKSSERYRIFRGPTKRFSKRPYLLWVSYVSLHGSSFSFLGALLSRVVVFVVFGSSLFFLDTSGVLPGWQLARSSFSMFYNPWARKDYSCPHPASKTQYASFELFLIIESCLAPRTPRRGIEQKKHCSIFKWNSTVRDWVRGSTIHFMNHYMKYLTVKRFCIWRAQLTKTKHAFLAANVPWNTSVLLVTGHRCVWIGEGTDGWLTVLVIPLLCGFQRFVL